MTEEEMIAALKAKGFAVEAPKTDAQLLQESFDAKLAEQERKFNERLHALGETSPQRKTLSASGLNEGGLQPEPLYQEGDYLAGTLAPTNWKALANRRVPWPADMDPNQALHELAPFLAYRLLDQEANAMGREVTSFVDAHERV